MKNTNILIAFDSSEASFKAVHYTGSLLGKMPGIFIKLLFVERLPDIDFFENDELWMQACKEHTAAYKAQLVKARETLIEYGVAATSIGEEYVVSCKSPFENAKLCSTGDSIVHDILRIRKDGNFGTIVIGRRGVSKSEAFLFGSVSNQIIHETTDCTVWVVN